MTDEEWLARCKAFLDSLRELCEEAISGEPHGNWERTEALRRLWEEGQGIIADARAEGVARLWDAEKLGLAELAGHIGLSRARADQFLKQRGRRRLNGDALPRDDQRDEAAPEAGER